MAEEESMVLETGENLAVQPLQNTGESAMNACLAAGTGIVQQVCGVNLGYGMWSEQGSEEKDTWTALVRRSLQGNATIANRLQLWMATFIAGSVYEWGTHTLEGDADAADDVLYRFTRATSPRWVLEHTSFQHVAFTSERKIPSLIQFMMFVAETYGGTASFWDTAHACDDVNDMNKAWYAWVQKHPHALCNSPFYTNLLKWVEDEGVALDDGILTVEMVEDFFNEAREMVMETNGELTERAAGHVEHISKKDAALGRVVEDMLLSWPSVHVVKQAEEESSEVDALNARSDGLPAPHCIPHDTLYTAHVPDGYVCSWDTMRALGRPGVVVVLPGPSGVCDVGIPMFTSSEEAASISPPLGPQVLGAALCSLRKHLRLSDEDARRALTTWLPHLVDSTMTLESEKLPAVTGHTELGTLLGGTLLEVGEELPGTLLGGGWARPFVPRVIKQWGKEAQEVLPGYLCKDGPLTEGGYTVTLVAEKEMHPDAYAAAVEEITILLTHLDVWVGEERAEGHVPVRAVPWTEEGRPVLLGSYHRGSRKMFTLAPDSEPAKELLNESCWRPALNNINLFLPLAAQLALTCTTAPSRAWYQGRRALLRMLWSVGAHVEDYPALVPLLQTHSVDHNHEWGTLPTRVALPGARTPPPHAFTNPSLASCAQDLQEALRTLPPWACVLGKTRDGQTYSAYVQLHSEDRNSLRLNGVYEHPVYKPWNKPAKLTAEVVEHTHRNVHVCIQPLELPEWVLQLAYVVGDPSIRDLFTQQQ